MKATRDVPSFFQRELYFGINAWFEILINLTRQLNYARSTLSPTNGTFCGGMEVAPRSWFTALVPLNDCFDKGDFCAELFCYHFERVYSSHVCTGHSAVQDYPRNPWKSFVEPSGFINPVWELLLDTWPMLFSHMTVFQMSLHSKAPTEQAPFTHAWTRCSVRTAQCPTAPHRIATVEPRLSTSAVR